MLSAGHMDKAPPVDEMVACTKPGHVPLKAEIDKATREVEKRDKPMDLTKVFVGLRTKKRGKKRKR